MFYDDEKLATEENINKMAKAYQKNLNKGFLFVRLDGGQEEALLQDVMETFWGINSILLSLGGFLGTGAMLSINQKEALSLSKLYHKNFSFPQKKIAHDKTKTFLSLLSHENHLTSKLISLAMQSDFAGEIFEIIKERSSFYESLFKINSIVS